MTHSIDQSIARKLSPLYLSWMGNVVVVVGQERREGKLARSDPKIVSLAQPEPLPI